MSLTLPEAAKLATDTLQRGVIETYARNSAVLEMLPFMNIEGNAYAYNQEETLPGVGFRGVNEAYEESTGVINQLSESLIIMGGDLDTDRFLVQTNGNQVRAAQDAMKIKSAALSYTDHFFNGDVDVTPLGFDGLKKRLVDDQVIQVGANGMNLTLPMLDALIDQVEGGPDVIYLNKELRRDLKYLIQNDDGYTENDYDAFGRKVFRYGGVPIKIIETNEKNEDIIGFNETLGTNNEVASIYAIKFGAEQYVSGLQNGGLSVKDLGELQKKPSLRTRVEWFTGLGVFHPKAAARLKGITRRNYK
ncbi:phage major capsid protein [Virgibacillus profundi]|uniref:Phage major capsid protein n=1 Tax=Virgibacillus profundi TaxID=2024555 RepID=A0A2A2IDA8_9BACI|nr:phage major capsid protein [Virgibacillus profundi]PAV29254.1 phage major capsid protein [Virgibacillus profundi]PXY53423.1 phage major capsid protein [Virgibacillus profundi]